MADRDIARLLEQATDALVRGGMTEPEALAVINALLVLGKAQERFERAESNGR